MKTKIKLIMAGLAAVTLVAGTAHATLVNWSVSGVGSCTFTKDGETTSSTVRVDVDKPKHSINLPSGTLNGDEFSKDLNLAVGSSITEKLVPFTFNATSLTADFKNKYSSSETITVDGNSQTFNFSFRVLSIDNTDILLMQYDQQSFLFDLGSNGKLHVVFSPEATGIFVDPNVGFDKSFDISATLNLIAVPEPSTVVAGILVLLPFGVSSIRSIRKNRL